MRGVSHTPPPRGLRAVRDGLPERAVDLRGEGVLGEAAAQPAPDRREVGQLEDRPRVGPVEGEVVVLRVRIVHREQALGVGGEGQAHVGHTAHVFDQVRTDRLVGTRPLPRDADELAVPGLSPGQVRTLLVRDAVHWKKHRCGRWIWREDGVVVAYAGLVIEAEVAEVSVIVAAPGVQEDLAAFLAQARADRTNAPS